MQIGDLIKKNREAAGISQKRLGKLFDYKSGQFISNIERGKCSFPLKHAKKLRKILKLNRPELEAAYFAEYLNELKGKL